MQLRYNFTKNIIATNLIGYDVTNRTRENNE